jgi:glutamyl endopeptidase
MSLNTGSRSLVRRVVGFGALVMLALSMLGTVPARAASTPRPLSPHTPVSSNGQTLAVAPLGNRAAPKAIQGFAGTGQAAKGGISFAAPRPARNGSDLTPASVIGADGRYQITGTTAYPYRAIVHISSSIGGCTGWLIGANTVATAGHCVYGSGAWATGVTVSPGRSGSSLPYGSCGASTLYSVVGWTQSQNRDYDYGAIKLNCSIGNTVGWFGFRWTSASLTGQPSYTAGYPGDKSPYPTLWRADDTVRISQTFRLYYANDTAGGQSGSPVWNDEASCSTCGIAIHAYGVDSTGYNGGTRITENVFNNLLAWRNA